MRVNPVGMMLTELIGKFRIRLRFLKFRRHWRNAREDDLITYWQNMNRR